MGLLCSVPFTLSWQQPSKLLSQHLPPDNLELEMPGMIELLTLCLFKQELYCWLKPFALVLLPRCSGVVQLENPTWYFTKAHRNRSRWMGKVGKNCIILLNQMLSLPFPGTYTENNLRKANNKRTG